MAPPSQTHLSALTDAEVLALIRLLSAQSGVPHDKEWFARQTYRIERLPKTLLRPTDPLARTISAIKKPLLHLHIGEEYAILCKVHKPLNPYLIRRLFISLCEECSNRNRYFLEAKDLPENIHNWIRRIESINSLWMTPGFFMYTFMAPPDGLHFDCIESGCEACIVATIGSSLQMILDLHASVLSRNWLNREPHLLRFLEDWLANIGGMGLEAFNEELGAQIMAIRKNMHHERHPRSMEVELGRSSQRSARSENIISPSSPATPSKLRKAHPGLQRLKSTSQGSSSSMRRSDSKKNQNTSNGGASYRYIPPSINPYANNASDVEARPSMDSCDSPDLPEDDNRMERDEQEHETAEEPEVSRADSVMDYYFSRLPSQNFAAMNAAMRPESIHPAFRGLMFGESVAARSVAGQDYGNRGGNRPLPENYSSQNEGPGRPTSAYSGSVYSDHPSKYASGFWDRPNREETPPPVPRLPEQYVDQSDPYGMKRRVKPPLTPGSPLTAESISRLNLRTVQEASRGPRSAVDSPYGPLNGTPSVTQRNSRAPSTRPGSIWIDEEVPESVATQSVMGTVEATQRFRQWNESAQSVAETTESTQRFREWNKSVREDRDEVFRKLTGGLSEAEFKAKVNREMEQAKNRGKPPLSMLNSKNQGKR